MRVNFEEVSHHSTKNGVCVVCGKKAVRNRKFWQTMNHFNKDDAGNPKSASQIRAELKIDAERWQQEPVRHVKCERR